MDINRLTDMMLLLGLITLVLVVLAGAASVLEYGIRTKGVRPVQDIIAPLIVIILMVPTGSLLIAYMAGGEFQLFWFGRSLLLAQVSELGRATFEILGKGVTNWCPPLISCGEERQVRIFGSLHLNETHLAAVLVTKLVEQLHRLWWGSRRS